MMAMKGFGHAVALTLLWPCSVAAKDQVSWGKAGVTLSQYRSDAVECGRAGAQQDISGAEPTRRFVRYFDAQQRVLNSASGAGAEDYQSVQRFYRPGQRVAEVQQLLLSVTERCLSDRGYRQFKLTKEQYRTVKRLPRGSQSRHAYLHSLASSESVLKNQVP